MTVLTRFEPFREFSTLQDRMNRLFQQSFGEGREEALGNVGFTPAVDVYEDEHNITQKIEVPGIETKDFDVRLENQLDAAIFLLIIFRLLLHRAGDGVGVGEA